MEDYKIALEAIIDESSLLGLQSQINKANIKPIPIRLDTKVIDSQIETIRSQIESLSKIKINFGTGITKNGSASVSQTTAAYRELLSIANQIDRLTLKAGGMKSSGVAGLDVAKIEETQNHLRVLYDTYQDLQSRLSQGNLTKSAFKGLKQDIADTKSQLVSLESELTSMQSKLVTGIKSDIANGNLGTQITEVENKYRSLNIESKEVTNNIQLLKTLMSNMDTSDDIESVTTDYQQFQQLLTTTINQVKALKREQSSINASNALINARTSLSSDIDVWLTNNSAAASKFGAQLKEIQSQISTADKTQLGNLKAQFQEITKQAKLAGVAGLSMGDQFKRSFRTVSSYLSSAMLISRLIMTIRNIYNNVLKVDTAMTGLKRVTNLTTAEYKKLYDTMVSSAKEYGATLSDIIDLTTSWVKLGFNSDIADRLAEISTMYQHVADVDTATANENLVTAYKGFQETLDETYNGDATKAIEHITDTYDKLNNEFAVTAANIGDAMQRSASSLQVAGNTFEQSVGMATGITEVIQDAEKAGSTLNIVSLRLRGMKGELEELGEEVDENVESISKMQTHILNLTNGKVNIFGDDGEFRSTYEIMKDIANVYDELDSKTQADLLETVAGKMRANAVSALISNFDQVEKATEAAYNSAGTAAAENEKYLESMQGRINSTKASWQALANSFMSSDFLKGLISGGQTFLDILNNIVSTIGTLPTILATITGYFAIKNVGRTKMFVLIKYADSNNNFFWIQKF